MIENLEEEIREHIRKKFEEYDKQMRFIVVALPLHLRWCKYELDQMHPPTRNKLFSFQQ